MNKIATLKKFPLFLGIILFSFTLSFSHVCSDDIKTKTVFLDDSELIKLPELEKNIGKENLEFIPELSMLTYSDNDNSNSAVDKLFNKQNTGSMPDIKAETALLNNSVAKNPSLLQEQYNTFNWNFRRILEKAPQKRNLGSGIKIGIIDSGIDLNHPELKSTNINQKIYTTDKNNGEDNYGHGTLTAGIINTLTPEAQINSYKVLDKNGGESSDIIKAIVDAVKDNVNIINISLSTTKNITSENGATTREAFSRAVRYAHRHNVVIVASAGNESLNLDDEKDNVHMPGGMPYVITVAATQKNGQKASYSNHGNAITVSAPAGDFGANYYTQGQIDAREMVVTYFPTTAFNSFGNAAGFPTGYTLSLGTSLAAPEVSATLATIMSYNLNLGTKNKYINSQYSINELKRTSVPTQEKTTNIGAGEIRIVKPLLKK